MKAHRLILSTLVSLCAAVGVLVCSSVSAQAAIIHDFLPAPSAAISQGVPAGAKAAGGEEALSGPVGGASYYGMTVAAGEAAGEPDHLWVAEEDGRVDEFNASTGAWESQLEQVSGVGEGGQDVAVGNSTGEREVYVPARSDVAVFGPDGKLQTKWTGGDTPEGSFGNSGAKSPEEPADVSAVAVDSSTSLVDWAKGDVFVSTRGGGTGYVVDVFKPEAGGGEKYVTQLKGRCPVAGATVGGPGCEAAEVVPFVYNGPQDMAVDPATGDLLVANGNELDFFEPVGLNEYRYLRRIEGVPGHSITKSIGEVAVGGGEGGGDIYISETFDNGPSLVVYQLDSEGVYLGGLTGTATDNHFQSVRAVAVDPASGEVYVGDGREPSSASAVDVFGPGLVIPDVETGATLGVSPTSAVLSGTVNPLGEGVATCQFQWGTTSELGRAAKCSAVVPEDDTPIGVHSEALEGLLQPDTTYYYRLQATNKNGTDTGEGTVGECEGKPAAIACFTTTGTGIEEQSTSDVASTSATLNAGIDPNHAPTSYYFEYGPTAAYGSEAPVAPGEAIGAGKGAEAEAQHVRGLAASTTYHYRVVAVSELSIEVAPGRFETKVETFEGPDQTFTTQTVGEKLVLPDGREWELVSPPDKRGASIYPISQEAVSQAAASGDAITYATSAPTEAEPPGNTNLTQVLSARESGGWVSRDLSVPHEAATGLGVGEGEEYRFFSEDLSLGMLQPFGNFTPSLSPEASEQTAFLRTDFAGGATGALCTEACYTPLVTGCPPAGQACRPSVAEHANVPPGTVFGPPLSSSTLGVTTGPEFVGGTPDLSHIVLGDLFGLQEWYAGKLTTVDVLPDGSPPEGGNLGRVGGSANTRNAISDDGSRVFWTSVKTDELYVRSNPLRPQSPLSPIVAAGTGSLTAGSRTVSSLVAAAGRGYLGVGGKGTLTGGSEVVDKVITSFGGSFAVGEEITGAGIPAGTTIVAVGAETLTLSAKATVSGSVSEVLLSADSDIVSLTTEVGQFIVGQPIAGEGIPSGTTIVAISGGTLTLSAVATASSFVTVGLSSGGPAPFAVGQVVRGAGIPPGTTITADVAGTLTLSAPATYSGTAVALTSGGECTVRADACTIQIGSGSARFELASSDGSRVFFSEIGEGGLYECEIVEEAAGGLGCRLTKLPGSVVVTSEDGSWLYVSTGGSLYLRHDGVTKPVPALSNGYGPEGGVDRVSPNGRWLAFMSQHELIPGEVTRDALSGKPDEEVYLYNEETGKLVCASCNPTGAQPVGEEYRHIESQLVGGESIWGETTWLAANIPWWTPYKENEALYQSRYLSDSGRLFFNSRDALVPQAVNGTWNVYEYEPPGVGSCTTSSLTFSVRSDGCVGLISSGTSDSESAFLDASESGGDVFFLTSSKLVPQDYDDAVDVYDAHECTTLEPCFPAVALSPPPCTTGDACKPAPTPQPAIFGAPSSETFSGAGNVTPAASAPAVTGKALTRAQKLADALKACRKKPKKRRAACERQARRAYRPAGKAKRSSEGNR